MKPALLIGVIGLALTGFLGYHALYVPQSGKARVIRAQIQQEQSNQKAQAELAGLLRDIEQYRKRLPPEPEASWLVREVVSAARKAGLELSSINPQGPQKLPQFTRLGIGIQFEATYHQVGAFLDELEHSDHFIRVDQVSLGGGRSDLGGKTSVRMELSTLYVPPLSAATP